MEAYPSERMAADTFQFDSQGVRGRQSIADLLLHPRGSPVLILIEDLHWADPSTLDVLVEIVTRQGDVPALMVCTTRPGSATPWQGALMG